MTVHTSLEPHATPDAFRPPNGAKSGGQLSDQTLALQTELAERKRAEEALRLVVEGTLSVTGEDFFRSLVRNLAQALQVSYAFVSEYADSTHRRVRMLAFWTGKDFGENAEYDLDGTPCEAVLSGEVCYYPTNIQQLFPRDKDLVTLGAEGYLGVPLLGSTGEVIGHLAVLDEAPLDDEQRCRSVLKIFATRAGAELERKRSEQALRLIMEGTSSVTGDDFFRSLVQHLASALQVRYAFISEYADATRLRVRMLAFWVGRGFGENVEYNLDGTPCEAVLNGEVCYHPRNVQALFPRDLDLVALGAEGYLGVPLFDSVGDVIGHLAVLDDKHLGEEARRKAILKIFAARAGAELERKRAEKALHSTIAELDLLTRRLTASGWKDYLAASARGRRAYDPAHLLAPADHGPARFEQPLSVRGEAIGRIVTAKLEGMDAPSADIVAGVAEELSAHLENLRLLEMTERSRAQLNKRAVELQTVARVSTAASTLDAEQLLQDVVDLTKSSFDLYHAHIYLLDDTDQALVLQAGAGDVGRQMVAEGRRIPLNREQSLVARAARTRQGVIVNDVRQAPDFLPHPLLPRTCSEMAIPIIAGERLLGVLDVQSDVTHNFSEEDVRVQTTLAAQIAVALQNAELYSQQTATVNRLRELDHLKSSFLANMSHELRTPLNSIIGFAEVMLDELDGPLTPRMRQDVGIIYKNSHHLLSLINDVLDMAKIEAGKMKLDIKRFNLRDVLEEVQAITGSLAREKSLELRIDADPSAALDIDADYMRLKQVLINLVGNAIKFTQQGGVTMRAERLDGHVRVSVRDTGIGIPPDKLAVIFDAFSQVDTSTTRKSSGTGLGLTISRGLVELHHGRMWAESTGVPGAGTCFMFELPLTSPKKA